MGYTGLRDKHIKILIGNDKFTNRCVSVYKARTSSLVRAILFRGNK